MAGYSSQHLEAFVDVVRLKSFSSVARKRGLKASSVARQISSLEEELGIALFVRTTRALTLTEAGRVLFSRSEHLLDEFEEAKREAVSLRKEVRGCLRLSCWPTFAKKCILPHLPALAERHPELRIDLDLSERLGEPAPGRTDLVIRIGELTDSTLLTSRLGTQRSVIVASPSYLRRFGKPENLADCASHRLIDKRHYAEYMGWRVLLGENRSVLRQLVLQTDDLQAQADACASGLGIAYLPEWVVADQLLSDEVKPVIFPSLDVSRPAGIYLLRNPGRPITIIEAFAKFLHERLSEVASVALERDEGRMPHAASITASATSRGRL